MTRGRLVRGVLLALGLTGAACTKVPAGHVGVKVYLLGRAKGVDHETLPPGRYWVGWNEDLFRFPTFKQNHVWGETTRDFGLYFQTREGLKCGSDIGITYAIPAGNVAKVFQTYRRGIREINEVFLFNTVRDAFNAVTSTMRMDEVYGPGKAQMMAQVTERVVEAVRPTGIEVEKLYLVGSLGLPETVERSIAAKIEATEKAILRENELRQAEAEAKKVVATARGEAERRVVDARSQAEADVLTAQARAKATLMQAKAEAEGNRELARSLTTNLVDLERAKRWNGKLPHIYGQPHMLWQAPFQ